MHSLVGAFVALVLVAPAALAQTASSARTPLDLDQILGGFTSRTAPAETPQAGLLREETEATQNNGSSTQETVEPAVSTVPEPSTVAMLLAGLALMGSYIRRR
jgi:outer membrane biosynthesis protein TonB